MYWCQTISSQFLFFPYFFISGRKAKEKISREWMCIYRDDTYNVWVARCSSIPIPLPLHRSFHRSSKYHKYIIVMFLVVAVCSGNIFNGLLIGCFTSRSICTVHYLEEEQFNNKL